MLQKFDELKRLMVLNQSDPLYGGWKPNQAEKDTNYGYGNGLGNGKKKMKQMEEEREQVIKEIYNESDVERNQRDKLARIQ